MKNNKRRIVLSITVISLVLLILLGLTYAFFLSNIQGNTNNKSISVDTRNLSLTYGDGNSSVITATKIGPGTTIGNKTFTVTNTGNVEADYLVVLDNVSITYASTSGDQVQGAATTFESNDFVYTLTCSSSDNIACDQVTNETELPLYDNGVIVANKIAVGATHTYTITVKYLETGIDQSNDMNKALSARLNIADINSINPYSDNTNSLAYNIINNAMLNKNGTELKAVPLTVPAEEATMRYSKGTDPTTFTSSRNNATNYYVSYADDYTVDPATGEFTLVNPVVATSKYTTSMASTLVGKYAVWQTSAPTTANTQNQNNISKISTNVSDITSTIKYALINSDSLIKSSTEKELSITSDDYGNTYYYRGGVEDNYVNFAEMCWRIVRIEGDGSVKLILEDQDQTCASSNGNWNIPTTTGGSTLTGNFGYTQYAANTLTASNGTTTNSSDRYVMDYLNGTTNSASSMATAFKNFQTGTLTTNIASNYDNATLNDYLKIDNWCMNDKGYSQSGSSPNYTYTELSANEMLDKKVGGQTFYYDSYVRLYGKSTKEPTLKCNGTVMNKFGDNTTNMYVGTLTADEIAYAGGKVYLENPNYYLVNDYQKNQYLNWWSLSPGHFGDGYDYAYCVFVNGGMYNDYVDSDYYGFRPAVSLKSGATVQTGGNGTKTNPYVIQ